MQSKAAARGLQGRRSRGVYDAAGSSLDLTRNATTPPIWLNQTSAQWMHVKDIKEGITANERVLAEASATGASLKQHQATVMDKIQRVEAQAALKLEAAAGYVEEAMKSKAAVEAEAAAIAAKAAEDEAAIRSMRELMQEMTANHEALTKGVMDKYALLRKAVGDYNKQLLIAMSESALASTALSTVMA
ncbi:putative kinetochore protein NUF2 [Haematococcus lacustris]|uniref:Putative kinetochore protein NUF2 n=1 Tax=Haematococcus lacustris TaxID=44745 RepID=A0A699ZKR7_HAELA|nr:putative kinetochore protein NUF2 [Haematococcus lacustris]